MAVFQARGLSFSGEGPSSWLRPETKRVIPATTLAKMFPNVSFKVACSNAFLYFIYIFLLEKLNFTIYSVLWTSGARLITAVANL